MEAPIVDSQFLVDKRSSQSGFKLSDWTYVAIPGIPPDKKSREGFIRVRGYIDRFELKQFNLLPMKNGAMMLPINAAVRKKIGKRAGDWVQVVLFQDDSPVAVPEDFEACLLDSPEAHRFFGSLSESNQKYYIDWVEGSKKLATKTERIARAIERLEQGLKFYDWPKR